MNTPTQDMSHDMRFYSFSIKESWLVLAFTLMSSNFKCRTSLLQWWVLGWTQLQARRKAHLTVLLAFMGEPWSRSNTGGWLWHQAARWGSCAVCSLIQVESFDKFQRPGWLEASSIAGHDHIFFVWIAASHIEPRAIVWCVRWYQWYYHPLAWKSYQRLGVLSVWVWVYWAREGAGKP